MAQDKTQEKTQKADKPKKRSNAFCARALSDAGKFTAPDFAGLVEKLLIEATKDGKVNLRGKAIDDKHLAAELRAMFGDIKRGNKNVWKDYAVEETDTVCRVFRKTPAK